MEEVVMKQGAMVWIRGGVSPAELAGKGANVIRRAPEAEVLLGRAMWEVEVVSDDAWNGAIRIVEESLLEEVE